MNRRVGPWAVIAWAVLAMASCGSGDASDGATDADVCRGLSAPDPDPDGRPLPPSVDLASTEERAWLVRRIRMDPYAESGPTEEALGFDLDRHDTLAESDPAGCGWLDWMAPFGSPVGDATGVDSQLGPLLSMVDSLGLQWRVNETALTAAADGRWVIVLRARVALDGGVALDDAFVEASIFEGRLAAGTRFETELVRASSGDLSLPVGGQTIRLGEGRTTSLDMAFVAAGQIHASTEEIAFGLPTAIGPPVRIVVRDVSLQTSASLDGVAPGALGGHVEVGSLVDGNGEILGATTPALPVETTRSLLEGQADIDLDGDLCGCEALSFTMAFETVPVVIEP